MKDNPCHGCKKRWVNVKEAKTCHATCKDRAEFVAQNEARKKKKALDRDLSCFFIGDKEFANLCKIRRDFDRKRNVK